MVLQIPLLLNAAPCLPSNVAYISHQAPRRVLCAPFICARWRTWLLLVVTEDKLREQGCICVFIRVLKLSFVTISGVYSLNCSTKKMAYIASYIFWKLSDARVSLVCAPGALAKNCTAASLIATSRQALECVHNVTISGPKKTWQRGHFLAWNNVSKSSRGPQIVSSDCVLQHSESPFGMFASVTCRVRSRKVSGLGQLAPWSLLAHSRAVAPAGVQHVCGLGRIWICSPDRNRGSHWFC